jgi:hypothetical protein
MSIEENASTRDLGCSPRMASAPLRSSPINFIITSNLPFSTLTKLESHADAMLDALSASIMHYSDFCLAG